MSEINTKVHVVRLSFNGGKAWTNCFVCFQKKHAEEVLKMNLGIIVAEVDTVDLVDIPENYLKFLDELKLESTRELQTTLEEWKSEAITYKDIAKDYHDRLTKVRDAINENFEMFKNSTLYYKLLDIVGGKK